MPKIAVVLVSVQILEKMGITSNSYGVSVQSCTEGKSMNHMVFSDVHLMNIVAKLLPSLCENFEVHQEDNVICGPTTISKEKLGVLLKEAKFSNAYSTSIPTDLV